MKRPLNEIAFEIRKTWPKPCFGAIPYIDAMFSLDKITDSFGYDSGESIVAYFLSNAKTWRGPDAKRIKKDLKSLLNER